MNNKIEILKTTRSFLLNIIKDLNTDQLNKIPEGFNNNIIWNLAHLTAAQQGVCYKRAGLTLVINEDHFLAYKPDTKPERIVDADGIEEVKNLLLSTLDQFQLDYNQNIFSKYPVWTTRYGVDICNIDEAIDFLFFHEGLHTGYIMALKRSILNNNLICKF